MQFDCLECGKRLRVSDEHVNPKVRCPNCGLVFRPQAAAVGPAVDWPAAGQTTAPEPRPPTVASRPVPRPTAAPPRGKNLSGAIGVGVMLLVMVGPQLARQFFRGEREPPQVPAAREVEPLDPDILRRLEREEPDEEDDKEDEARRDQPLP